MSIRDKIQVYAFVGPSGTGKSYRAGLVASEHEINYIIDDGLFIKENEIIAGNSAKKAPTKIETVKQALFIENNEKDEVLKAIKKYKPERILILGTSDNMVKKIAQNLGLPEISKFIYISEIATEEEMQTAKRIRTTEGKHVIPVPTFELKKDFSGYILDPLQIFKSKGKGAKPYISEKSIIRPTFSYLGNFTISDSVFRQIIDYMADKTEAIYKIAKTRVDTTVDGENIYIEIIILYGYNIMDLVSEFKMKVKKEIERLTAMNVQSIDVVVKGPAGVGKGTIANLVAEKFGFLNVDTGAMYRSVTLAMLRQNIGIEEEEKIEKLLSEITIELKEENGEEVVLLNGEDVSEAIRTKEVNAFISGVSALRIVRNKMLEIQRKIAQGQEVVMEGRDIGSTVFPNADVKIYLDATVEERANRRLRQNKEKGIEMSYEEVLESVKKRDLIDSTREVSPLRKADDAILIDCTELSLEQLSNKVYEIIEEKMKK